MAQAATLHSSRARWLCTESVFFLSIIPYMHLAMGNAVVPSETL